jgi:hypothetical protein
MSQIKRFNQKLDMSLNYFLNDSYKDKGGSTGGAASKKLDSEIEQNVKEIKDRIVEQANKKEEVTLNRLKLEEIEVLNVELVRAPDSRDLSKVEEMLMKLRYFKNLNP